MLVIIMVLSMMCYSRSKACMTIDDFNTVVLNGQVYNVEKVNKKEIEITCLVTKKSQWYDNLYSIIIDKAEWKAWQREEGKVKRNTKVKVWLYKNETNKNIYDDVFIHINKR